MILRLTVKALTKIKEKKFDPEKVELAKEPLSEWYVNHFLLDRKGFFIITESKSLYSIIAPSVGISSKKIFLQMIETIFINFETKFNIIKNKISEEMVCIYKTNNRSILGSQTELIRMAEAIFYYDSIHNKDLSEINETPMMFTNSYPNKDIMNEIGNRK
jgi:hypothetical protein